MSLSRKFCLTLLTAAMSAFYFGCGGSDGKDGNDGINGTNGTNGLNALVTSENEAAGTHCANGGLKLSIGLDKNANNTLDADEVLTTQYVCNGADGQAGTGGGSTITTTNLAAGEGGCENGGVKLTVTTGDNSTDTVVCNGANGDDGQGTPGTNGHNSLIKMTDYTGDECESGSGLKIESGLDANDNGTLDAAEVTSTKYICNGKDGEGGEDDPCDEFENDEECVGGADNGPMTCAEMELGESTTAKAVCVHPDIFGMQCTNVWIVDEDATLEACDDEGPDVCMGLTSDSACISANGGPISCKDNEYADAPDSAVIVCKEHATCEGVMVVDEEATAAACTPPQPPISWCNTQDPGEITAAGTVVYGRVPTAGVANIQGMQLMYGTDPANFTSWSSIPATKGDDADGNAQYAATMSAEIYNALAAGTYYYAMAVSGDGTNWFYCPHTGQKSDSHNDDGGTPSQTVSGIINSVMGMMVISNGGESVTYIQNFDFITSNSTGYADTGSATDANGITWTYVGRPNLYNNSTYYGINDWDAEAENNPGRAVILRNSSDTYIQAEGLSGVSSVAFAYNFWGSDRAEITVVSYDSEGEVIETQTTTTMTAEGASIPGTASVEFSNSSSAVKIRLSPNTTVNKRIIIDDVVITK